VVAHREKPRMLSKRSLVVFTASFAFVLIGGMALAQVGTLSTERSDTQPADLSAGEATANVADESPVPAEKPQPAEEPKEKPAEEPKEKPAEEPKEKPAEEPKEKPAEEPKEKPADTTPPGIEVLFPKDGAHVTNHVQVFEGWVEEGATVARGKYQAAVNGEGWRIELVLSPGENRVPFVATDAAGNQAKDWVTVYYDAPKDTPTEEPPPKEEPKEEPKPIAVDFTAHQKYGSCGEAIPYDVFHGTATPGTKIWIESPHGSAAVKANDKGNWEAKVKFETSEPGVPFTVVVETSEGDRAEFTFVNTRGGGEH
jgi:hypothetical protein